ncbi:MULTISPECIES: PAS domain S-box protein [unclassified Imperialibacter]|uniref:PAS domain-containing sensor histidine kinase n=1 Tax=unclassified Imperialibacter TaxID=2629706 RepID=UPI00125A4C90|nr:MULTISPECIES: PAS domain S-box protein [unclassified Imperialibacter]CAD5249146.1 putative Histidine kinase [Imperialibacter sp. 89]CAD5264095.1 putative Histidine kinase [Imperialibacter sp. 75]VVT07162.1 putative Histidine kinase [Imperialibacter sp. EC-SDR9]
MFSGNHIDQILDVVGGEFSVGLLYLDESGKPPILNQLFKEQFGLPHDACWESFLDIVDPSFEAEVEQFVKYSPSTGPAEVRFRLSNSATSNTYSAKRAHVAGSQVLIIKKLEEIAGESFPDNNPFPVMRISSHGQLMYANESARELMEAYDCQLGAVLPAGLYESLMQEDHSYELNRVKFGDRFANFKKVLVPGTDYHQFYGIDVTRFVLEEQRRDAVSEQLSEELKSKKKSLQESYDILRQVYQNEGIGVFFMDTQGSFISANEAYQNMAGYAAEELSTLNWMDITPPDDLDACEKLLLALTSEPGGKTTFEKRILRKDGSYFYVKVFSSLVESGEYGTVILGLVVDINDMKDYVRELEEAKAYLTEAQQLGGLVFFETNLTTGEMKYSDSLYGFIGIEKTNTPLTFDTMIAAFTEDTKRATKKIISELEMDITYRRINRIYRFKNGLVKHAQLTLRKHLQNGDVKVKGTIYEVTNEIITLQSLREKEATMLKVQKMADLGSFSMEMATGEIRCSSYVYTFLGLPPQSGLLSINKVQDVFAPVTQRMIAELVNITQTENEPKERILTFVFKDNTVRHAKVKAEVVVEGNRKYVDGILVNVSKEIELELMLASKAELLNTVQSLVKFGWWENDFTRGKVVWSGYMYTFFERPVEAGPFSMEEYLECLVEEDRKFVTDLQKGGYSEGKELKSTVLRYLVNGNLKYTITSIMYRKDPSGKVVRIGSMLDITDNKAVESNLQKARIQQHSIINNSASAIIIQSKENMVVEANKAFCQLFELDCMPKDLIGLPISSVCRSVKTRFAQPSELADTMNRINLEGKDLSNIQFTLRNGKVVEADWLMVRDEEETLGYMWSFRDVTSRVVMEQSIRDNLNNVNSLLLALEDLIVIFDQSGRQRKFYCNDLAEFTFTEQKKSLPDKETLQLSGDELTDNLKRSFRDIKRGSQKTTFEFTELGKWFRCTVSQFETVQGANWMLAHFKDVTKLKKISLELRAALKDQIESNQMKTQFISMASHQFRTPLTVILNNIQLLDLIKKDMDPRLKKVSDRVQVEVKRLTSLMNDVLTLGKIDSGHYRPKIGPVNLMDVLEVSLEDARLVYPGRTIKVVAGDDLDSYSLKTDKYLLEHVFSNLVSNAMKYSEGSKDPEIYVAGNKDTFIVTVKDHGIGIQTDEIDKVFDSFYRSKHAQGIKGTGLGLAIVKEFCKLIHADIVVDSQPGKFTKFTVTLQKMIKG